MPKDSKNREGKVATSLFGNKIVTALLIIAAFGVVIYLGVRKRGHRLDAFAQCLAAKPARPAAQAA